MKRPDFVKVLVKYFIVAEVLLSIILISSFALVLSFPLESKKVFDFVLSSFGAAYGVYIIGRLIMQLRQE